MEAMPLVSVPVITYNSSKTVLETLESIKSQTYQNIELIISDDCSTDNTVQICKNWVETNGERFVRTVVLESPVNTGISANGNRAEAACQGEWVKGIAGDDLLMSDCIESFVNFVQLYPDNGFFFAGMSCFGASEEELEKYRTNNDTHHLFNQPSSVQLDTLFQRNFIQAPTFFYNSAEYRQSGVRNDERIPMMDDWPKWINLLRAGADFVFMDKDVVRYRISSNSVSNISPSIAFQKSLQLFYIYYQFPYLFKQSPSLSLIVRRAEAYDYVGKKSFLMKAVLLLFKLKQKITQSK